MTTPTRKALQREASLGVLYAAWWLHCGHGEDTYAKELLLEWGGRRGISTFQRLARAEDYQFKRGFWSEVRRKAER